MSDSLAAARSSAQMSDPSWAGSFDCSECGRKRLIAADFSKKMLEKRRADEAAKLRCKTCVDAAAASERDAAAAKRAAAPPSDDGEAPLRKCSSCQKELALSAFNRTQLGKGEAKQRCQACVASAETAATGASRAGKDAAIEEARKKLAKVEISGTVVEKLAVANELAALEAEKVTGLKPQIMGRARFGRGRGGGGGGRGKGR